MNDDGTRLPDPRMIPITRTKSWFDTSTQVDETEFDEDGGGRHELGNESADHNDEESGEDVFVRPFIVTGGRTRPLHDGLRIETLVVATATALTAQLHFEQRQIVQWCRTPISLAEIAALIGVPLGVARVLVADLYTDNLVQLREPQAVPEHVLERIRDLVRAL
ncbi:MAG TPA: DUF742 domain-containing protein [Pseudonocardiaceae bacterium]|jgi:hypothetical protein|nr:DUF742 domain-containing protein [Pseudonocardiaceae bacterium]